MNLVDYFYGGGEGCIKGGRFLVLFWGKFVKGGFRIVVRKCRN